MVVSTDIVSKNTDPNVVNVTLPRVLGPVLNVALKAEICIYLCVCLWFYYLANRALYEVDIRQGYCSGP